MAELGHAYIKALTPARRKAFGIYYTPAALAAHLVDSATVAGMDWLRGRAISPGCGGGQFLVEDARRMVDAMAGADSAIIVTSIGARLRGWDIDPVACWISQVAVETFILPHVVASGKRLLPITACRDSLLSDNSEHEGAFDLVNENPAFGKVTRTPALVERFGRSQRGHMNMYGLFTDLSLRLAKPDGGIVALLTPTSYLGGDYFARLRGLLSAEARPVSIDIVESRTDVFPEVLQEVALSCFKKGHTAERAACSVIHVGHDGLRIEAVGEIVLPAKPEEPWLIARSRQAIPLVEAMRGMESRLADWGYRVKTGPLVPHKNAARMKAEAGAARVPVIWAECVTPDGRFVLRCDRSGRSPFYEPVPGKDANVVTTPCLLLQRTTAKEQHRRLIGAVMSADGIRAAGGRVSVENHLNMVVPTGSRPAVPLKAVKAFFASSAADRAFRCISGSVAVSATEIEAMPLPSTGDLLDALSTPDPESALRRLYGIVDGKENEASRERAAGRGGRGGCTRRDAAADPG